MEHTIEYLNSAMAECRKLSYNKKYMTHNSMNGQLLLIYTIVLMIASHCSSMEIKENNNNYCSDALTCTKCIINTQCKWSLDKQVCIYTHQFNTSSLMVYKKEECPRVSVVTKHEYDDQFNNLEYTVKVSNDVVGFMNFLRNSTFICNSSTINVYKKEIKSDEIVCSASIKLNYFEMHSKRSFTAFIYIQFNGVMLRFDNISDHYVTILKHQCAEEKKDEYCATCTWDDYGIAQYVRLCSSENTCEGHNEVYMRHNRFGVSWNSELMKIKDRCAEINVTAVRPLYGPLVNGTIVTIVVKNHRELADNRTVIVTVAGTDCANPTTSGSETITCTTSLSHNVTYYEAPSGPILVTYASHEGNLIVESSQTFQFYESTTCGALCPALVEGPTLHGIISGGTKVTLEGVHFVEPHVVSRARLFVKLPNGTLQFASSYCDLPVDDTHMVCRSPRVDDDDWFYPIEGQLLNFGLNLMNFTGNQSLYVNGPSFGYYMGPDPVLEEFFEFDLSGSVMVRGRHMQHVQLDDYVVQFLDSPGVSCENIYVGEHRLLCRPTTSTATAATPLQAIDIKIGELLVYHAINKSPFRIEHHSNSPYRDHTFKLHGWCIAIILLVIVCAIVCYLRMKNRYEVLKNDRVSWHRES